MKNYMLRYTHMDEDHEVNFVAEDDEQARSLKARFEADGLAQDVELFDENDRVISV